MTLKAILESVDLAAERKKEFETKQTRSTYWSYYDVLTNTQREELKDKMIASGYTFASGGGIYSKETGKLLDDGISLKESEDKITLGMIRDIEMIDGDDKNYFISYSSKYAETPEHDELPKKLIRKLLKDNNVDGKEFWDNFVPYLNKKDAQVLITDIFGEDTTI